MDNLATEKTSKNTDGLEYVPPPLVEDWFWTAFNKLVPDAPGAPVGTKLLRIVWGCDRTEFCGGFWERRYGDTDNDPPKYVGRARWVLEGYQPPTIYSEAEWELNKHLLGEFPINGVYDFVTFHTTNTGDYLPLDQSALNHVELWRKWQSEGKQRSTEELLEQKRALRLKRYTERKEAANKVAKDFGEKVVKLFESWAEPVSTSGKNYKKTEGGILVPA